ncbi:MAG: hypothetical protein HKM93_17680, partial [Desulfobacteraceae bacterium]|nr:hypothetical protein [Desulfobacteraceae bacterium]
YKNALTLAVEHQVRSIAFPAVSCGVYGYPITDACGIAVDTCVHFLGDSDQIEKIIFVLFSEDYTEYYLNYIRHL